MKIKMIRPVGEIQAGRVIEVSDAQANYWIRVKAAAPFEETKPQKTIKQTKPKQKK